MQWTNHLGIQIRYRSGEPDSSLLLSSERSKVTVSPLNTGILNRWGQGEDPNKIGIPLYARPYIGSEPRCKSISEKCK